LKSLFRAALLSLLCSTAAYADDLRIDGTSKESFAKSVGTMAATVAPADKEAFQKGLLNLIVTKSPPAAGAEGLQLLSVMPQAMEVAHVTLDGYTRDQILEHGRKLAAAAGPAPARPDGRDQVIACLQKHVTVSDARVEKGDFGHRIALSVTNRLSWALLFVHVHYVVSTPGRSVPWADETFGGNVSGGIEPGETKELSVSAFRIPQGATNLVATAEVMDVADPQRRQLVGKVKYVNNSKDLTTNKCE